MKIQTLQNLTAMFQIHSNRHSCQKQLNISVTRKARKLSLSKLIVLMKEGLVRALLPLPKELR